MGTQGLMGRSTMIPNAVPVNNVIVLYSAYHFMFNYCLIFNVSQEFIYRIYQDYIKKTNK